MTSRFPTAPPVEEPGGPDRATERQARLDRGQRPAPAPGLPPQGGPAYDLPDRPRRRRAPAAVAALDRWLSWARRCRIPAFTELARKVNRHHDAILHAIFEELSNGLIESTNTKTRLIIRRGFGFHSADAVIALVMLCLGGNRPTLPRRQLA